MLPLYVWILVFIGRFQGERVQPLNGSPGELVIISLLLILGAAALIQLLELPFGWTFGLLLFRLDLINARGERAGISVRLFRWAVVWLPLLIPLSILAFLIEQVGSTAVFFSVLGLLILWGRAAFYAVMHPHRGLYDRLAGTWVVRR